MSSNAEYCKKLIVDERGVFCPVNAHLLIKSFKELTLVLIH